VEIEFRREYLDVFGLALLLAGSPTRWDLLFYQNHSLFPGHNPFNLPPGALLTVYVPERRWRTAVRPRADVPGSEVQIRPDQPAESLYRVAERTLGHAALAHYLREAAGNEVSESGVLEVGQELFVPALVLPDTARYYWPLLERNGVTVNHD
jgi:hypothetical protein